MASSNPALPKGSTVLLTGVNGFIASHIADQLLQRGYRVRGTTRDATKADWIKELFEKKYGQDLFEVAVVEHMGHDGAFDKAVKGVAGVIHVASDLSFDPDPNKVIPPTLAGVRNALQAAASESSVKRFVLTSSSLAAVHPVPNKKFHVDGNSWNQEDVDAAWAPPPYEAARAFTVYGSSKVEGEKAAWKFVEEKKPSFVLNCILPNFNVGPILSPKQHASTTGWVRSLYRGEESGIKALYEFVPQYAIDVRDDALLHVAALLEPDVKNERLFGFAEAFNYNKLADILRTLNPPAELPPNHKNPDEDLSIIDTHRAEELLKRYGQPGFRSFDESVRAIIASG